MPRLFHHSLHFEYRLFPKQLKPLFVAHLLRGMGLQMVGLFIPLYLFQIGMQSTLYATRAPWLLSFEGIARGLVFISGFYLIQHVVSAFLAIPLTHVMKYLGLVKSMVVANVILMMAYLLLGRLETDPWLYICIPFLCGIEIIMYWTSYYTEFAVHADLSKIGSEVGSMAFLEKLARAAMPMIGGMIITMFGFRAAHLFGVIIFILASVPLFLLPELKFDFVVHVREFIHWFRKKHSLITVTAFAGKHLDDLAFTIWPVYLFIFTGTIDRVGYFYSVVLFISLILSYFMGWYLGKHKGRLLFYLSGFCMSAMWVFRASLSQLWHILATDLTDRLAVSIFTPIFDTIFLRKSRGKHVFHFHIYREVVNNITAVSFWLLVIVFFMLPVGWVGVFTLAALGVVMSLVMQGSPVDDE